MDNYTEQEQLHRNKIMEEWEELLHKHRNVPIDTLTSEQLDEKVMKDVLFTSCITKEHFRNWIKVFLKVDLPDTTIDPGSNSNPLQVTWDIYKTAVWYDEVLPEDRLTRSVIYANRGGFKTFCACIAELAIMIHTGRNVVHVGLILGQAKNAYDKYFRPFLDLPYIKEHCRVSSILEKSIVNTKDKEIATINILPCTMNATSGPRAQLLAFDEIDKASGEQLLAYVNSYGMRTATNNKELPMTFAISTRDSSFGLIQDEIDNADKRGTKVFHWNAIDITERCPDERSGTNPVPIYIKKDSLSYISEDQFKKLPSPEKRQYEKEWGLDGCLENCKIFGACKAFLKNQDSKCKWLKTIEDTQTSILSAPSEDMAIAQLLCRKPPTTGIVYSDISKSKNLKTPSQMYRIFAGIDEEDHVDPNMSIEDLIEIFQSYNVPIFIGVDAGYHFPCALLVAIDKQENVYVLKEYRPNNVDSPELAQYLGEFWGKYKPNLVFVDPESPDCTSAMKKQSFIVSSRVDKSVQIGISTLKGLIRVPGTQKTKLFFSYSCPETLKEMGQKYKYKTSPDGTPSDVPDKKNDHGCIVGDSVIHTTNGDHEIQNLVGEEGEVYCYDTDVGRVVASKFWNVHRTGNREVYKVTLDNGQSIETTRDHKFLTRFYGYRELGQLEIGDSLMPFNRHYEDRCNFNHKVISIEYVGDRDVYDMTVGKYHNYATNGIIIHNCDALRYVTQTTLGRSKAKLYSDSVSRVKATKEDVVKQQLSPSKVITEAYGGTPLGVGVDNRADFEEKDGKLKKKDSRRTSKLDFTKF